MPVRIDDPRLMGTWRLIATTSGTFDLHPCVRSGVLLLNPGPNGAVHYSVSYRTPARTRRRSGRILARPTWARPRSWLNGMQWLLFDAVKGRVYLSASESIMAVASPGTILTNPGSILFARADVSDEAAWSTVVDDMDSLHLTSLTVRELSWRIKAWGTVPRRYSDGSPA